MGRLAIISGSGSLPAAILQALSKPDNPQHPPIPPLICSLAGYTPDNVIPDIFFRIEKAPSLVRELKAKGVTHITFAGALQRPKVNLLKLEPGTFLYAPKMLRAMKQGDDTLLRGVIGYFEDNGFTVVGVQEIAPELLPKQGVYVGRVNKRLSADVERAAEIVHALGAVDVGQGCIVAQGQCLALETLSGTDAMLASMHHFPKELRPNPARGKGVFYKAPKPRQDLRIDLPTIGPQTLYRVSDAGLGALVWKAQSVICLDFPQMIQIARDKGIVLWAR